MKRPRVFILDIGAETTPPCYEWEAATDLPPSVGPEYIAKLLCEYRNFIEQKRVKIGRSIGSHGDISEYCLGELILFAFRASFLTDEGRPIRARVVVRHARQVDETNHLRVWAMRMFDLSEDAKFHAYHFPTPIILDGPKVLAKLAPILTQPQGGITVKEHEGKLYVTGLANLEAEDTDWEMHKMPRNRVPSAGLLVEILGPGYLRVREDRAEFTLVADRLVTHAWVGGIDCVASWLHDVSMRLIDRFRSVYQPEIVQGFISETELDFMRAHKAPHTDLVVMLSRMLRTSQLLGHGGAFAILPKMPLPQIEVKNPLTPINLGSELVETWSAQCRVLGESKKTTEATTLFEHAESKRVAVQSWLSRLRWVAQFSAADGCVILDKDLVLHGFGGKIADIPAEKARKKCVSLPDQRETTAEDLLKQFGTRHASAFALCHEVPYSLVFVISQDGDLRLFASDETTVYFASGLHP